MKKFLRDIIFYSLFLIVFFILLIPLDRYFSEKIKYPYTKEKIAGEFEVWDDIYNGTAQSHIAIYGSSRAWVHISPQIIEDSIKLSSYNFGADGHSFEFQYLRHKIIEKENILPKTIIHSLDAHSLQNKTEFYNKFQAVPYMLWDWDFIYHTSHYQGFSYMDYIVPLLRFRHDNNMLFTNRLPEYGRKVRKKGYRAVKQKWNNDFDNAKEKHKTGYKVMIDNKMTNLYEKFISDVKKKNIEIIMVYTPEYIEGQKFINNRKEIINLYRSISTKYNIPFLDYSNSFICFDKKYFYNATHLNAEGSELFTKILIHDIKRQNLIKNE